ncbi:hypothetical protein GGI22_005278, partial [Coemansia erecta]
MNDCVLFYYRNKKSLHLKDLEAKSNKRVRRSRQAGTSSGGGAGGRKRKERARERRERKTREEREKLAQEAAAGCAPVEYSADLPSVAASADGGQTSNVVRSSAFPSDDEDNNAVDDARGTPEFSAEEIDVLERRSKNSALLRSIIAANRQRKNQTAIYGSSLLGLGNGTASDDSSAPLLSPMNDGDEDDDIEDGSPTSATAPNAPPASSKRSSHQNGIVFPGNSRRKSSEPPAGGRHFASGPLSPISPRVAISVVDSRSRQADDEEDGGSASIYVSGSRGAVTDEIEEGEERGSVRAEASAQMNTSNSEDDDGEEEGELVEDSHWEPQRRSRLYMELTAYAMGGSIVRTRRGRELERERFGGGADGYGSGSGTSDDERGDRKGSPADLSYDEEDEIVEASGIVGGRLQAAGKGVSSGRANSSSKQQARPQIVSRRSQSRFGATLTAVLDPNDSGRSSTVVDQGNEASTESSLYLIHRQTSHQRHGPPGSPSATGGKHGLDDGEISSGELPKESALDRYVVDGTASEIKRPISSYEALFMCSPVSSTTGIAMGLPIRGTGSLPVSDLDVVSTVDPGRNNMFNSQRQRFSSSPSPSGKSRLSSAPNSKKQLDVQIEEEAGPQNSVLVGAAAWLREDRKRVLRGFHKLGPDFAQVASLMPSKTMAQCRYFYYHYRTPAGVLLSEIIPNSLSLAAASAAAQSSDSKYGIAQPGIGSLVLPQIGMQASTDPSKTITSRTSHSGAQRIGVVKDRPTTVRDDIPLASVGGGAGTDAKRQRTKSPVNHAHSSSDDEDDETPLAAQLAETLAAQVPAGVNTLAMQQRRASGSVSQVRPELINPRVASASSLVLPSKSSAAGAPGEFPSGVKGNSSQALLGSMPGYGQYLGVGGNSAIHGIGRTPSPHTTALSQAGGAPMTAKKSGYSSYWSVHERSAFMHYV